MRGTFFQSTIYQLPINKNTEFFRAILAYAFIFLMEPHITTMDDHRKSAPSSPARPSYPRPRIFRLRFVNYASAEQSNDDAGDFHRRSSASYRECRDDCPRDEANRTLAGRRQIRIFRQRLQRSGRLDVADSAIRISQRGSPVSAERRGSEMESGREWSGKVVIAIERH